MKKLFFILLLLTACGPKSKSDPRTIYGVDPAFNTLLTQYISLKPSHRFTYNIAIGFATLPYPEVGQCRTWTTGERQISIDPDYWYNRATPAEQVSLLFHELGHCDLDRGHSSDSDSIMYKYNVGSDNFDELFGIHHSVESMFTISEFNNDYNQ